MKKVIYLMAFVLTTLLSVSCGSDDGGGSTGDPSEPIVGNWKMTGYIFEGTTFPTENEPCDDEFYKFNSNGTGKYTEEYCDEPSEITEFTWEKSGGSIYTVMDEFGVESSSEVAFSNSNKVMTVYAEDSSDYGAVFQRQ